MPEEKKPEAEEPQGVVNAADELREKAEAAPPNEYPETVDHVMEKEIRERAEAAPENKDQGKPPEEGEPVQLPSEGEEEDEGEAEHGQPEDVPPSTGQPPAHSSAPPKTRAKK